jgi:hypothetical protein
VLWALYSKKKAPPFEAKFQEMLNFEGPVWNGGFPKEKQRNEFHRKVFLTCCLEQRKLHSFPKERVTFASQNIEKEHPRKSKAKNFYNVFSSSETLLLGHK